MDRPSLAGVDAEGHLSLSRLDAVIDGLFVIALPDRAHFACHASLDELKRFSHGQWPFIGPSLLATADRSVLLVGDVDWATTYLGFGGGALRDRVAAILERHGVAADQACGPRTPLYLDAEYAALCRKLVARLARKRPSPIVRGDPVVWAAAAIHTVGAINFLFDPAERPHLTAADISRLTGVPARTVSAKSKLIRDVLRLKPHDPELCRRQLLRNHPSAWLVELDGLVVDARALPRELLEEASRRGLIPDLSLLEEEQG